LRLPATGGAKRTIADALPTTNSGGGKGASRSAAP